MAPVKTAESNCAMEMWNMTMKLNVRLVEITLSAIAGFYAGLAIAEKRADAPLFSPRPNATGARHEASALVVDLQEARRARSRKS